ncbi:MAG: putative maturation protein [Boaesivirus pseudofaecivicinum]|uniref:Maturation protein n=1 Tax=Leviviridae sp. TaxID=2027243 RepID=A0ABY3SV55_9VIRU|nr:MAG: putative maturation protein [Leviviridae sp.]
MTGRVRTESLGGSAGTYRQKFFGTLTETPVTANFRTSVCTDSVGNFPIAGELDIDRIERSSYTPLNGIRAVGVGNYQQYDAVMPVNYRNYTPPLTVDDSDMLGLGSTLLARTNPSRPVVSLPVFIGEIRDAPRLIRLAGDSILRKGASGYLSWEFGWKPLLSDLRRIMDFEGQVNKRVSEIQRISSRGGLRRRVSLGSGSTKDTLTNVTLDGVYVQVTGTRQVENSWKTWGTVRWLPDPNVSLPTSNDKLRALARKAIFGLSADPGAISAVTWNLIPWSWLVDWFTNAGDFLEAHNNTVPAVPYNACIMKHVIAEARFTRTMTSASSWVTGGDASIVHHLKMRRLATATLAANLPFLSGRQLSILGALAITRSR